MKRFSGGTAVPLDIRVFEEHKNQNLAAQLFQTKYKIDTIRQDSFGYENAFIFALTTPNPEAICVDQTELRGRLVAPGQLLGVLTSNLVASIFYLAVIRSVVDIDS